MGAGEKIVVGIEPKVRYRSLYQTGLVYLLLCWVGGMSAEGKESQDFKLGVFTSKEPCQSLITPSRPVCVSPFPYVPVPVCDCASPPRFDSDNHLTKAGEVEAISIFTS